MSLSISSKMSRYQDTLHQVEVFLRVGGETNAELYLLSDLQ